MNRKLVRRSFLGRVLGGGALLVLGGTAEASSRPPRRGLCSDADRGPRSDPHGAWYGDRDAGAKADPLARPPRMLNDTDVGPNADRAMTYNFGRCPAKPRARS